LAARAPAANFSAGRQDNQPGLKSFQPHRSKCLSESKTCSTRTAWPGKRDVQIRTDPRPKSCLASSRLGPTRHRHRRAQSTTRTPPQDVRLLSASFFSSVEGRKREGRHRLIRTKDQHPRLKNDTFYSAPGRRRSAPVVALGFLPGTVTTRCYSSGPLIQAQLPPAAILVVETFFQVVLPRRRWLLLQALGSKQRFVQPRLRVLCPLLWREAKAKAQGCDSRRPEAPQRPQYQAYQGRRFVLLWLGGLSILLVLRSHSCPTNTLNSYQLSRCRPSSPSTDPSRSASSYPRAYPTMPSPRSLTGRPTTA